MYEPSDFCDLERLRLLLADQLSEAMQEEVSEHLSNCETCRRALDAIAGDPSWWSEVQSRFRADAQRPDSSGSLAKPAVPDDDALSADHVVDYLEPCDQPGTLGRLGEYEILEVIGRAGLGVVLKGYHRGRGRYVAIKVLARHLGTSGAARRRFVRDARALAVVISPKLMPIPTAYTTTQLPYVVMAFSASEPPQERIDRHGSTEVKETVRIGNSIRAGCPAPPRPDSPRPNTGERPAGERS